VFYNLICDNRICEVVRQRKWLIQISVLEFPSRGWAIVKLLKAFIGYIKSNPRSVSSLHQIQYLAASTA
jgi:hypothetical protein